MPGCCPYGPLAIGAILFATLSFFFTYFGAYGCNFIAVDGASVVQFICPNCVFTDDAILTAQVGLGFWTIQKTSTEIITGSSGGQIYYNAYTYNYCGNYPDGFPIDAAWKTGQAFGIMASVFAFAALVIICFTGCLVIGKQLFYLSAGLSLLTSLFLWLSLSAYASNLCKDATSCKPGYTFYLIIVAGILWILTALMVVFMKKEPEEDYIPPPAAPVQPKTETHVRTTNNPDGTVTKTTTTTVTNPDGSKTVTETVDTIEG